MLQPVMTMVDDRPRISPKTAQLILDRWKEEQDRGAEQIRLTEPFDASELKPLVDDPSLAFKPEMSLEDAARIYGFDPRTFEVLNLAERLFCAWINPYEARQTDRSTNNKYIAMVSERPSEWKKETMERSFEAYAGTASQYTVFDMPEYAISQTFSSPDPMEVSDQFNGDFLQWLEEQGMGEFLKTVRKTGLLDCNRDPDKGLKNWQSFDPEQHPSVTYQKYQYTFLDSTNYEFTITAHERPRSEELRHLEPPSLHAHYRQKDGAIKSQKTRLGAYFVEQVFTATLDNHIEFTNEAKVQRFYY